MGVGKSYMCTYTALPAIPVNSMIPTELEPVLEYEASEGDPETGEKTTSV